MCDAADCKEQGARRHEPGSTRWRLLEFRASPAAASVVPLRAELYVLSFAADASLSAQLDCNRARSTGP
jgi:hypothetical protein